ncbi:hypothetical protein [Algoriphagus sp.]|uniref:DUF7010 family protein n=1 Tax=Algoriphagus sp. TaxID=1872435 RepID=UPI00261B9967|nr:hypothetical protein [Algoriphagus sp.]
MKTTTTTMNAHQLELLDEWRTELSIRCKNGINFIFAATLIWAGIAVIWNSEISINHQSILTFSISGLMLPLAWVFGKLMKTAWNVEGNPLNKVGLIFNLAQFFYFPFLFILLGNRPEYFALGYAIITGAHFFPYAWYYKTNWFGVFAGLIPFGSYILSIYFPEMIALIPTFVSGCLGILGLGLVRDYRLKIGQKSKGVIL